MSIGVMKNVSRIVKDLDVEALLVIGKNYMIPPVNAAAACLGLMCQTALLALSVTCETLIER